MNFSIENRVPLLDRGLFEFAYSIPNIHMMRNGFGKAVFREAMRGISPDFVLDSRDKHSLNVPFKMLIGKDSDRVHQYLLSDGPIYDLVDKSKIGNILEMPERPNSWDKFLFALLGCKLFLEEFG
jgi:asparagine synthase (glutamine-hydrolysing)